MSTLVVMSGDDAVRIRKIAGDAALLARDLQQGRSLNDPVAGPLARGILGTLAALSDRQMARALKNAANNAEPSDFFAELAKEAANLSTRRVPPPGPEVNFSLL